MNPENILNCISKKNILIETEVQEDIISNDESSQEEEKSSQEQDFTPNTLKQIFQN
jgi:hypothetical protein